MSIDLGFIAELRDLKPNVDLSTLESLSDGGFSIGALVELACTRKLYYGSTRSLIDSWSRSSTILIDAIAAFENHQYPSRDDMWSSRPFEFFPIIGQNWADKFHYHPFESRFQKAAKEAGFGTMALAITGALFEMADNVIQHSGGDSQHSFPGLIGYYICPGHIAFAIGDAGRGVLASLKDNPDWSSLSNSKAALLAIIDNSASRRVGGGDGGGFKQVFRSLVDLNGIVEMHSGDGRVQIQQTPRGRQANSQFMGSMAGFQLSINCSLTKPEEKIILI